MLLLLLWQMTANNRLSVRLSVCLRSVLYPAVVLGINQTSNSATGSYQTGRGREKLSPINGAIGP